MKKPKSKEPSPLVYVPAGARINEENTSQNNPITTKYEKRRVRFDIHGVKNISGGNYGKRND